MQRVQNIITAFEKAINTIENDVDDILFKAEKCIKESRKTLELLNSFVVNNTFKEEKDEIHFFKNQKPKVFSRLIYYVKLFCIEGKRPRGSNESQIKYLNDLINKLQEYLNDNLEFYHYYRKAATSLDKQYFVRGKEDLRLYPDTFHFYTDRQFSTSHDSTVATILAYDMLIIYLKREIDKLSNNGMETIYSPDIKRASKLFWTAHKTDLTELIYALHSTGAINNGTADIKEVATICEQIFNINLGNYYHTFIELKSRKSNNTKFLDILKDALINRMRDSDG